MSRHFGQIFALIKNVFRLLDHCVKFLLKILPFICCQTQRLFDVLDILVFQNFFDILSQIFKLFVEIILDCLNNFFDKITISIHLCALIFCIRVHTHPIFDFIFELFDFLFEGFDCPLVALSPFLHLLYPLLHFLLITYQPPIFQLQLTRFKLQIS